MCSPIDYYGGFLEHLLLFAYYLRPSILAKYPLLAVFTLGLCFHCLIVAAWSLGIHISINGRTRGWKACCGWWWYTVKHIGCWCSLNIVQVCEKSNLIRCQHSHYSSSFAQQVITSVTSSFPLLLLLSHLPTVEQSFTTPPSFNSLPLSLASSSSSFFIIRSWRLQSISMRDGPINSRSFAIPPC